MDILPILHVMIPVSIAGCVALKKDAYSNNDCKNKKWLFGDVIIILSILACVQLSCLLSFRVKVISAYSLIIYGTIIFSSTVGVVAYISIIKRYGKCISWLRICFRKSKNNILLPVVLFLLYVCVVFLYAHITHNEQIISARTEKLYRLQIFKGPVVDAFVYLIGLILIAPVVEEIVYRGIFFAPFERKLGGCWAIFMISLIWAFTHLNINGMISVFFIGVLLGYLYKHTKSLLPGIIFHSLFNSFAVLIYIFR